MDNQTIFQYAGTFTGFMTSMLFYPVDTYKSRLQASHSSSLHLYRGIFPEMISNTASNAVYWSLYQYYRNKEYSPIKSVLISSIISNLIDSPLDYLKKHRQLNVAYVPSWIPLLRYSILNSSYSCVYNCTYMYILSTVSSEKRNELLTLLGCSMISSSISYPIDYMRTCSIKENVNYTLSSFIKGYVIRLAYSTCYSTFYMKCFLLLTGHSV